MLEAGPALPWEVDVKLLVGCSVKASAHLPGADRTGRSLALDGPLNDLKSLSQVPIQWVGVERRKYIGFFFCHSPHSPCLSSSLQSHKPPSRSSKKMSSQIESYMNVLCALPCLGGLIKTEALCDGLNYFLSSVFFSPSLATTSSNTYFYERLVSTACRRMDG